MSAPAPEPILVGAKAAALLLGVSVSHFYELVNAGRIPPGFLLGRARRWLVEDLHAWARAGTPSAERWAERRTLTPDPARATVPHAARTA